VWAAIASIFRDNQLSRAVYIDRRGRSTTPSFRATCQSCSSAPGSRATPTSARQHVTETQQVLNLLRGLGRGAPVPCRDPEFRCLPCYGRAPSSCRKSTARQQAAHALYPHHQLSRAGTCAHLPHGQGASGSNSNRNRNKGKKKAMEGHIRLVIICSTAPPLMDGPRSGLSCRARGAGVLGPRPGTHHQHAGVHGCGLRPLHRHASSSSAPAQPWDMHGSSALQAALNSTQAPAVFLDPAHHPRIYIFSNPCVSRSQILVGNGALASSHYTHTDTG
jgi:hypothetical protein